MLFFRLHLRFLPTSLTPFLILEVSLGHQYLFRLSFLFGCGVTTVDNTRSGYVESTSGVSAIPGVPG